MFVRATGDRDQMSAKIRRERASPDACFQNMATGVEEMAQEFADAASRVDFGNFIGFDHARGNKLRPRIRRAKPCEFDIGLVRPIHDLAHSGLGQQDFSILLGICEEGHRQDMGRRAGLFGNAMHHVMGVGGIVPRQPAKQGYEGDVAGVQPGKLLHGGRHGAAMAKPDHGMCAALDFAAP